MTSEKKINDTEGSLKGQESEPYGQNCSLCQQYRTFGIKNKFKCCKRCRSVKVKVKNIKPMIPEIKNMLNKHKHLKQSDVRYHKEEKVVTDVQIEGIYTIYIYHLINSILVFQKRLEILLTLETIFYFV